MCAKHLFCYEAKQPNLKLKTQPKQVLGYLPMAFALPAISVAVFGIAACEHAYIYVVYRIFVG